MTTEQNEIKSAEWRKKNLSKNSVSADVSGSFISKFKEIIYSDLSDSEIVNALHKLDNDRSVCVCEMPAKIKGKNECWRCKKPFKEFLQTEC